MDARRLAVCISAFEYGGQGTVVEQELTALREHFRVTLLADVIRRPVPEGIHAVSNAPGIQSVLQSRGLIRQLREVDVIHCHDSLRYMWAAQQSGVPWIVTSHGICPNRYRGSARSRVEGSITKLAYPRLYRKANRVVAISAYIRTWLATCARVDAQLIRNGLSEVDASTYERPARRSLLYVGEVSRRKGIGLLIFGLKNLPSDVTLTIVGKGHIKEYADLATRLSVTDRVSFTGEIGDTELRRYYRNAFAVISASQWEGFGLPILEGFGHGRPALVRPVGGLWELVDRSRAGLYFSDSAELRSAFVQVDENWETLSRAATRFALGQDWTQVFDAYRALLLQCVESAGCA